MTAKTRKVEVAKPLRNKRRRQFHIVDLHGVGRLAIRAAEGIAEMVDAFHGGLVVKASDSDHEQRQRRALFFSFRENTRLLTYWLDSLFEPAIANHRDAVFGNEREAVLAGINGVIGDYLAESAHPWAIEMCLRSGGEELIIDKHELARQLPDVKGKILIMVHGLCRNDLQWRRARHDHGAVLARDLGYTPIYLHYNSGRHVSQNGRQLATLLELLIQQWPVDIERLSILCHSMGGLVARSACYYASGSGFTWLRYLKKMIFLATPHHGSPIERGGNWLVAVLDRRLFTAPLAKLGRIRSAGITDLRYGNLLDEDWLGRDQEHSRDCRHPVPLPDGVDCYVIAGATGERASDLRSRFLGDGLMMPDTALGRHRDDARDLHFPATHQWIAYGANHLDLLSRKEVYQKILEWMRE